MAAKSGKPAARAALIVGASGLTGRTLLEMLLADSRYQRVHALVRKATLPTDAKLVEHVVDFDHLAPLPRIDDAFCCLGTTIKRAGSQAAFRTVDFEYVVNVAKAAAKAGAKRFLVVSALGASATSAVFYSRVKGEMEDALKELGFAELHIFQPSLLTGNRPESRPAERAGIAAFSLIAPLMLGPSRKYRPIAAEAVAAAMLRAAWRNAAGTHAYPSDVIAQMAGQR